MKYVLFLSLLVILASCSHSKLLYMSEYNCENEMEISAQYYSGKVELFINGLQKELHQTVSASGAKYATENGLEPERGLIWWTKGNEATMFEIILDHTADPDDYKQITVCKEK